MSILALDLYLPVIAVYSCVGQQIVTRDIDRHLLHHLRRLQPRHHLPHRHLRQAVHVVDSHCQGGGCYGRLLSIIINIHLQPAGAV